MIEKKNLKVKKRLQGLETYLQDSGKKFDIVHSLKNNDITAVQKLVQNTFQSLEKAFIVLKTRLLNVKDQNA